MELSQEIDRLTAELRAGRFNTEAAVSQGIVLSLLHALGWPVFDVHVVTPEYELGGRRVDLALCHPNDRPLVIIEIKRVGHAEGADRQLFEYAFHAGVPMAVLTDGQEWSFYLPGERGDYQERRVYKLDLLERAAQEIGERLDRYLSYERVSEGSALEAARADYRNVARARDVTTAIPAAWKALLEDPDSILVDALAEKTEDLCGYKPDLDQCTDYLASLTGPVQSEPPAPPSCPRAAKSSAHRSGIHRVRIQAQLPRGIVSS